MTVLKWGSLVACSPRKFFNLRLFVVASETKLSGLGRSLSVISTVPLCFNSHCTAVNVIIILLCEKHVHSTTKNLLEMRHINSLVHEYLHIYVQLSTGRYGIL